MQTTSYISISQQMVLSRMMDVISNNIANASTPGFKVEQPIFREYQVRGSNGQMVSYVHDAGVYRDDKQGDLTTTNNPLDLGIQGSGYFTIQTPDGTRYSRSGRFQLGESGQIETDQGYAVLSTQNQPIVIPQNAGTISIANDGTVSTAANGAIGQIRLSSFANPEQLVSGADGLYVTDATPAPDTTSVIHQGMIESSNVVSITQLTRLMGIQQAYSGAQKMVTDEDSRIRNAIDKLAQAV
jgi:flagellar basal-body rod protein FlgF